MSVLIKGMEMPKSCSNCNWSRYSFPNAWCSMTHHKVDIEVAKNGRPDGCPLIEVPEPHGRLINAEQLKETLDYYIREAGWSDEINKALSWVKDEFIDAEPTVIPASEKAE